MKSLKQNYDKHLIVTVIVLVALPILLGSSIFILTNDFYRDQVITFFFDNFNDINLGSQFLISLRQLQYVIFAVMLILYPVYPFIFSIEKYTNKRNPKAVLTEYQTLKKIVYALLPLFFFAIALIISKGITEDNPLSAWVLSLDEPAQSLLLSILTAALFAVASALLRIILLNRSKAFNFYQARRSFRVLSRVEDDVERMKYLISGLGFYNRYLRGTLDLEINNLKMIYSKIIADTALDKNHSMEELCGAFEGNDKLKPITCLIELFDIKDPEHFLVKESAGKKLEEWVRILVTVASTIAAVMGAVITLLGF
jgi:hypothetical protein